MAEAADLIGLLKARKQTVATAESCTGGLLGKLLTDVPGSSAAYLGGVISYTCPVKERVLGVDHETLEQLGPVSKAVARQMAEGARALMGSDFALATTGLAGPDGDGSGKPVGLVYIAAAVRGQTYVQECHFTGNRAKIRESTVAAALTLLRRAVLETAGN